LVTPDATRIRASISSTCHLLVTDFLCDGLGFDKYADLTTEYQVKGEFADYGLRIDRELVAFIEVKRVATKLSTRHLRQVEMYAVNEGVEWIILTNGSVWRVYTSPGASRLRSTWPWTWTCLGTSRLPTRSASSSMGFRQSRWAGRSKACF
jgi:hypothetical protein